MRAAFFGPQMGLSRVEPCWTWDYYTGTGLAEVKGAGDVAGEMDRTLWPSCMKQQEKHQQNRRGMRRASRAHHSVTRGPTRITAGSARALVAAHMKFDPLALKRMSPAGRDRVLRPGSSVAV